MTPANTRKQQERARKVAAGLKRIELWVPAEREAEIKALIEKLLTPRP